MGAWRDETEEKAFYDLNISWNKSLFEQMNSRLKEFATVVYPSFLGVGGYLWFIATHTNGPWWLLLLATVLVGLFLLVGAVGTLAYGYSVRFIEHDIRMTIGIVSGSRGFGSILAMNLSNKDVCLCVQELLKCANEEMDAMAANNSSKQKKCSCIEIRTHTLSDTRRVLDNLFESLAELPEHRRWSLLCRDYISGVENMSDGCQQLMLRRALGMIPEHARYMIDQWIEAVLKKEEKNVSKAREIFEGTFVWEKVVPSNLLPYMYVFFYGMLLSCAANIYFLWKGLSDVFAPIGLFPLLLFLYLIRYNHRKYKEKMYQRIR